MNRQRILNSNTSVINAQKNRYKTGVTLIYSLIYIYRPSNTYSAIFSHFVEVFTVTESDVASRYSKESHFFNSIQVGIIFIYYTHKYSRYHDERAMRYLSFISYIYHTVTDMQHLHFEAC